MKNNLDNKSISLQGMQMKIIQILRENAKMQPEEITSLLGPEVTNETVTETITMLEQNGFIVKYKAVINWNKLAHIQTKALIEVKVTPQRGYGFDRIAQRIYNFPEVKSCYLISGAYDLLVELEGDNLQEIAEFVSEKLSTLDSVLSTVTHFILKKYKDDGDVLVADQSNDDRLAVTP